MTPDETPIDLGAITPIKECDVSFRLKLCTPDDVNEIGRNAGLPLQAVSLTFGNVVILSWPPGDAYGYRKADLYRDLGKELIENVLKLTIDKS